MLEASQSEARNLGDTFSTSRYSTRSTTTTASRHNQNQAELSIANMWRPSILLAAALAVPSRALHFFIDGAMQKCFFEELPKDTMVVGMAHLYTNKYGLFRRDMHAQFNADHSTSIRPL